jgi:hypothetical protein
MNHQPVSLAPRRLASVEERNVYHRFLKQVGTAIPTGYLDIVKERHPELRIHRIQNVRTDRTADVRLLVLIVRETLPEYPIPDFVTAFLDAQEGDAA